MEDAREQIPLTTSTPHQKGSLIGIKHFTTCEPLEACPDAQTGIDQTIQKELSVRARRKLQNRNAQRNLRLRRAQEQQQQQQLLQQQEQGQEQQSQHQPQEQPEQQPQQQPQHQPDARSTQPPAAQRFEQEDKWSEGPRKSSKYTPTGELDSSTSPPRQHSPIRYEHPLSDDFLPTLVDLDEFAPWDTYPLSPVLSCSTTAQKVDPSVFPLQASHRGVHAAYCGGGPGHEQFVACECGQQTCNPPVESVQSLACVQGVKSGGSMAAPGSLEGSHMRLAPRQGPQVIQVPTPKSPAPRRMSHSCKPAVLSARIPKETHMPDSWQRSVAHPPNFQRRSSSCTRRRSNGKTTLHLSAAKGHGKIVRYLLNSGTEPDTLDGAGLTALHHAARNGHTEVAAILLEKGADIEATNRQGWTALHMAADLGWEDILRLLVEEGANLGARIEDAGLSDVSPE